MSSVDGQTPPVDVITRLLAEADSDLGEARETATKAEARLAKLPSELAPSVEEAARRVKRAAARATVEAARSEDAINMGRASLDIDPPTDDSLTGAFDAAATATAHAATAQFAAQAAKAEAATVVKLAAVDPMSLLTELRGAIDLMKGHSTSQAAIDATAKIAQAGALTLVEDHLSQQPQSAADKSAADIDGPARIVALVAAVALLFVAAWMYANVQDTAPVTDAAGATTTTITTPATASGTAVGATSGTTSPPSASTPTAATTSTNSQPSTPGSNTTGANPTSTAASPTGIDATGVVSPPLATAQAGVASKSQVALKKSHLSSTPIAFVIAATLLAALALFAPRVNSVTASKESIALTLTPQADPLSRLTKAFATVFPGGTGGGAAGDGGSGSGEGGGAGSGASGSSGGTTGGGSSPTPPAAVRVFATSDDRVLRLRPEAESRFEHLGVRYVPEANQRMMIQGLDGIHVAFQPTVAEPQVQQPAPMHPAVAEKVVEALTQAAFASSAPPGRRRLWPWAS